MKSKFATLFFLLLFAGTLRAQSPNWADDIAPILYANCTGCHNPNGIAPFSMLNYSGAYANLTSIAYMTGAGFMPPWPPNPDYQHFAKERVLTDTEKQLIADWVGAGGPPGDTTLAPPPPVYPAGATIPNPDLSIRMPAYQSQAFAYDDYICVALETNLATDRVVRAIDVIPANRSIVHHCLVFVDDSNTYISDSIYGDCGGPAGGRLLGGYVPGSGPILFPDGDQVKMGVTIPAGSQIILAMHYPEGSAGLWDSTRVNLHFFPDTVSGVREIYANPLIQDWSFCVNANEVKQINVTYPSFGTIPSDFSLLSIFPHSHLLGKTWKVYSLDQAGDTTRMIDIPHWDFEWQGFYFFDYIKKIPSGSRIFAQATYDNTANNIHNPNQPPQTVCAGLNTTDEMYLVYFHYTPYQPGDEFLSLDTLLQLPVAVAPPTGATFARLSPFPNPSAGLVTLDYYLPRNGPVSLTLHDLQGRQVKRFYRGKQAAGQYQIYWDGSDDQGKQVAKGLYLAILEAGGEQITVRLMRE